MKSIDIIEAAKSYYLLSNDKKSKPVFIGTRIKLEYVLEGIDEDMIIATAGNDKKCIILVDFTLDQIIDLVAKGDKGLLKLKSN